MAKPVMWLAVLVVGALGGSIQGWLEPRFTSKLNELTESGDLVKLQAQLRPPTELNDMWLPPERQLTEAELSELHGLEPEGQSARLEQLGAVPVGVLELEIWLTGNRADEVQIIDLRPTSDCSQLEGGSLIQTSIPGIGGFAPTTRMMVAVEDEEEQPTLWDGAGVMTGQDLSGRPFFDEKSITLGMSEREFVLAELQAQRSSCVVNFTLTVLHRDERHSQLLLPPGQEITIAGIPTDEMGNRLTSFEQTFVGGWRCPGFQEVSDETTFDVMGCPSVG